MYIVKINGGRYEVEDGVYNPPLPQERIEKDAEHISDIVKYQQCPGLRTDTDFHAGRGTLLDQMDGDENWCKHITSEARKRGYSAGANDVYIGQLADYAGDPKAFFKPGEGRSEMIKRAKACGKGLEAPGVSAKARPYVEKEGPVLSNKNTKSLMEKYKAQGTNMNDQELRAHVVSTHGKSLTKGTGSFSEHVKKAKGV